MDGVGQHVSSDSDSLCQLFCVCGPQCFPSFPPQLYRRSFQVIDLREVEEECYLVLSHFRPEETGDLILRDGTASGYRLGFCYSKSCSLQLFPVFPWTIHINSSATNETTVLQKKCQFEKKLVRLF